MKISTIIEAIEDFAPLSYQEGFDNSGLNIGTAATECSGFLLCFEVSERILEEAVRKSCNLIICHHPVTLAGLKTFRGESNAERIVARALQHNIAIYACHTPLDSTPQGINTYLGQMFSLQHPQCLQMVPLPRAELTGAGLGVIGYLPQACSWETWVQELKAKLSPAVIRHSRFDENTEKRLIHKVAFCGGSGGSLIPAALKAGADVYVCGDLKYHDFADRRGDMILMDPGHFETEHFGIQILYDVLRKKIPTFAGSISENIINPIHYIV